MNSSKPLLVVLVGLPGAGKTTVGAALAHRLGFDFIDSDQEVERSVGSSVASIFESQGEAAFREYERQVIVQAIAEPGRVVALGGGALTNPSTRNLIKKRAVCIWLDPPAEIILERIESSSARPLFRGVDPQRTLRTLSEARRLSYADADFRIETVSLEETLRAIERQLRPRLG